MDSMIGSVFKLVGLESVVYIIVGVLCGMISSAYPLPDSLLRDITNTLDSSIFQGFLIALVLIYNIFTRMEEHNASI